jgi:hypothetical protein
MTNLRYQSCCVPPLKKSEKIQTPSFPTEGFLKTLLQENT